MRVRIEGNFDDIRRKLDELRDNAARLHGRHQIPAGQLFAPTFMAEHTDCASITQFFNQSGLAITSQEDLARIPQQQLDAYVAAHSRFATWSEMQKAAVAAWAKHQLGF